MGYSANMRSGEPQVVGAVAAVVSAFHGGAELVTQIKKKHKKRKGEQAYKEKQLQESLQSGEVQIETRYGADCREMGEYVKRGDVIARDRLLHIAVAIQAEIIRSLQLAVKYENAILDLTVLHETSIMNRKDTLVTLDELKQRILITFPPERMSPPALDSPGRQTFQSTESLAASMVPDNYLPPGITIPDQHESDSKSSLSRFLSTRRTSGRNSVQHSPSNSLSGANFTSGYQFLGPPIQESSMPGHDSHPVNHADIYQDINDTLTSFQGLHIDNTRRDTLGQLQGLPQPQRPPPQFDPADLSNHPAFTNPPINLADISSHPAFAKSRNMGNNPGQRVDSPSLLNRNPSTSTASVYSDYNAEPTRKNVGTTFSQPFDANSFGRNDSTSSRSAYSDRIPASVHSHSSHASVGTTGSSNSAFSPRTSATSAATPTTPVTPDVSQGHFTYSLFPQVSRKGPSPPPLMAPPPPPPARALPSIPAQPVPPGSNPPLSPSALKINNPFSPSTPPASSTPTSPSALSISAPFSPNANTRGPNTLSTSSSVSNVPSYSSSTRPSLISNMSNLTRTTTSSSNTSTPSTINAANMLTGRPCKQNNYWGFCKGSWAVREELKKGLSVQTRPEGLYNNVSVWQCKHCLFQGDTFHKTIPGKKKKEIVIDPNIHTSAVGIKYRFIFLAKSHVKRKSSTVNWDVMISGSKGGCSYGCVICCAEGKSTSIFGNVNTLMNHIFNTHAKGMTEEVQRSTKCVVGREPEPGEQWDVCIPFKRFLGDGTAVAE
ncbi:hypothetical protein BU16DRAFT_201395 [Lophium mytilinum]|uniref:Uncharacterized protein n=1 Tax=Lophium mytilinum TaxID=390894 RepID=A0A6A6R9T7_9PEZI|nr:hypothetical protein BU16DRAFT_201395 [Lophium mytilinum]